MGSRLGSQTINFDKTPTIISTASTVGPKEGEGPLSDYFDVIMKDALGDEKSWEKAESKMVENNLKLAVKKAGLNLDEIDYILAGDLLNQSIGTTFGIRELNRPFFGLYGACSTFGESILLGAVLTDSGFANHVLCGASSHFCAAEKQFRFPLELGTQRTPTSSWTVTGDGALVLALDSKGPAVTHATTGKIVDMGIKDVNNMGAAMAPAAVDTIIKHFEDTGRSPEYYDLIITGDLGHYGKDIAIKLAKDKGYDLSKNYTDCGIEIFDKEKQDTHAGGSGCGCSAVTFCGYYYLKMLANEINRILFIPTGALLSTTSSQQGESIPGIAHALAIENK